MKRKTKVTCILMITALFMTFSLVGSFVKQSVAAEKVFNWKFSSHTTPASGFLGKVQQFWCDQVEKRTNGRIKVRMYWRNELCGDKEMVMAAKTGLADVVGHVPAYTPGDTPLMNVIFLPFAAPARVDWAGLASNAMAKVSEGWKKEMDKHGVVYGGSFDTLQYNVIGNKPVTNLKDLKGVRIRCMPELGNILSQYGAVPMSTPFGEMYSALSTGVVDDVAHQIMIFKNYKLTEISKYLTVDMDMGGAPTLFLISKKSWNPLSPELQKSVQSVIDDLPAFCSDLVRDPKTIKAFWDEIEVRKIKTYHFPKEDRDALVAEAAPVWDLWAKNSGTYDLAKKTLVDYLKVAEEVQKEYPNGYPGSAYKAKYYDK